MDTCAGLVMSHIDIGYWRSIAEELNKVFIMSLLDKFKKPFEKEKQSTPDHVVGDSLKKTSSDDKNVASAKTDKKDSVKPSKTTKKEKKESKSKVQIKDPSGHASRVIVRPLQTEKNSELMVMNKYVFEVSPKATKSEVKKAFKALYDVEPVQINIMTRKGKVVRSRRMLAKRKDWRRAIITLKQGDTVEIFEGV